MGRKKTGDKRDQLRYDTKPPVVIQGCDEEGLPE